MNNNLIDNRQIRVFISSTFRDMQDERDVLMKKTFPRLRKMALERDVTLTELDLRWGITEDEAKSGKVVEICLREIENCVPFFIGIIGNRYGWIPEKDEINGFVTDRFPLVKEYLDSHLAVTEMEMQFGVLDRNEDDLHAFFFIKEQKDDSVDEPEKLAELKRKVRDSKYSVMDYVSVEDLAEKVEKSFIAMLDELFPEGDISEIEKERIGHRTFMHLLCQNYIRDEHNFIALDEWMQDWNSHYLVITGASGLGKSALIANWSEEKLKDSSRDYNIINYFVGKGGGTDDVASIVKYVGDQISELYDIDKINTANNPNAALTTILDRIEGKKPLLIVFDAINQIQNDGQSLLLNWIPAAKDNVKFLFSTLEDNDTMDVFRRREFPEFVLQPLDAIHRKLLIAGYLHQYSKELTDAQIERIANDKQCENTLVLKSILNELINFGIYEKLDEKIDSYLNTKSISEFFQVLLEGYENDYGRDTICHILSLIHVSMQLLNEAELMEIVNRNLGDQRISRQTDKDTSFVGKVFGMFSGNNSKKIAEQPKTLTPLLWSQIFCSLDSHLHVINGRLSFKHIYIRQAVIERYQKNKDAWSTACLEEIIGYFRDSRISRDWSILALEYWFLDDDKRTADFLYDVDRFNFLSNQIPSLTAKLVRNVMLKNPYFLDSFIPLIEKIDDKRKRQDSYLYLSRFCIHCLMNYSLAVKFGEKSQENVSDEFTQLMTDEVLGLAYIYIGEHDKANENLTRELNFLIKHEDAPNRNNRFSFVYGNMGLNYHYQGDLDNALKYYLKSADYLDICSEVLTSDAAFSNICNVYMKMGDMDKAKEYLDKTISGCLKYFGDDSDKTACAYILASSYYNLIDNFSESIQYGKKGLSLLEKYYGVTDHNCQACLYIGLAYKGLGKFRSAIKYCTKSLELREYLYGMDSVQFASVSYQLGIIYHDTGDFKNALTYLEKSLPVFIKCYGAENSDTISNMFLIGDCYMCLNKQKKAINYLASAHDHALDAFGPDSESYINICNSTGACFLDLKNYESAKICFENSASKNNPEGMYLLSLLYMNAYGVDFDGDMALSLLEASAELGYEPAIESLKDIKNE